MKIRNSKGFFFRNNFLSLIIAFISAQLGFLNVATGQNLIVEPITFHGCDISLTKITDPKRSAQPVAFYMQELVTTVNAGMTSERLSKWLGVEDVLIEESTFIERNQKVKNEDILFLYNTNRKSIDSDSLQKIINGLDLHKHTGTGIIVFYEYLSKERKSVSGYVCFFNHATLEIITVVEKEYTDDNGYGSFRDYWVPARGVIRYACETFRKQHNPK